MYARAICLQGRPRPAPGGSKAVGTGPSDGSIISAALPDISSAVCTSCVRWVGLMHPCPYARLQQDRDEVGSPPSGVRSGVRFGPIILGTDALHFCSDDGSHGRGGGRHCPKGNRKERRWEVSIAFLTAVLPVHPQDCCDVCSASLGRGVGQAEPSVGADPDETRSCCQRGDTPGSLAVMSSSSVQCTTLLVSLRSVPCSSASVSMTTLLDGRQRETGCFASFAGSGTKAASASA